MSGRLGRGRPVQLSRRPIQVGRPLQPIHRRKRRPIKSGGASLAAATTLTALGAYRPANDDFANAVLLTGTSGTVTNIITTNGTLEATEPDAAGRTDTVWYHYVAASEGTLTLDTTSTSPAWNSVVDVFTGTALVNLVLVGTEPQTYQGVAEAGDVWIRLSTTNDSRLDGIMTWSFDGYLAVPNKVYGTAVLQADTDLAADVGSHAALAEDFTLSAAVNVMTPSPDIMVEPVALTDTPTTINITLANCSPDETVSFKIDGTFLPDTLTVDETGGLGSTVLAVPFMTDGTHTLTAIMTLGTVDTTLTVAAEGVSVPSPIPTPPSAVTQTGVVRWIFQDKNGGTPAQYIVPINPDDMTSPFGERAVTTDGTTAIDGQTIMWEGIQQPVSWTFSGTVLDETHYDNLVTWSNKPYRIYIIDHYNRAWELYIQKLDITPKRAVGVPWRHHYQITALITRGPVTPV